MCLNSIVWNSCVIKLIVRKPQYNIHKVIYNIRKKLIVKLAMYRNVCSAFICCQSQRCYHNLHENYSCCFNVICVLCYRKSQCEANFTFDTTDSYIFSLSNDMTVIIVLVYMSSISHLYQNPRKACNWFNCDINWVLTNPKFSLKYTHKHDINNIFCDILCDLWHIISCIMKIHRKESGGVEAGC